MDKIIKYISINGVMYKQSDKFSNKKDSIMVDGIIYNKTNITTKKQKKLCYTCKKATVDNKGDSCWGCS